MHTSIKVQKYIAASFILSYQSGTVVKFDNVVTSQHGVNIELGEFSERVPSLRQLFGCVRAIYPELQVVNIYKRTMNFKLV